MSGASQGRFYGVGVGPGDPELITRKAERVLREVDWVFCPASPGGKGSFAARIVEPLGLPAAKFRTIALCMTRDRRADQDTYARAAAEIVAELRCGKSAAWITEGDPLFYSTFWHLYEQVCRQAPESATSIVPGVSSVHAAAAQILVPLGRLDERVAIVPAAYSLEELPSLLEQFATVVLLKVHAVLETLLDRLERLAVPVRAYCVEKVGTAEERLLTDLAAMRGAKLSYFSLVILRREGSAPATDEEAL